MSDDWLQVPEGIQLGPTAQRVVERLRSAQGTGDPFERLVEVLIETALDLSDEIDKLHARLQ
jgi:hypothetical protein